MSVFSDNLKYLRKERKVCKVSDVINETGITKSLYYDYENGKVIPNTKNLKKLAKFFNTTTIDLLGERSIDDRDYYNIGIEDKNINKLNDLRQEKIIQGDLQIEQPTQQFINMFIKFSNDRNAKAFYEYMFYPNIKNKHYDDELFTDNLNFYDSKKEALLLEESVKHFKIVMQKIRKSKEIEILVSNAEKDRIERRKNRLEKEKRMEEKFEKEEIDSMLYQYNNPPSNPSTPEEWE